MSHTADHPFELSVRKSRRRWKKVLAWGVHLYTAMGLVAAALTAIQIVQGSADSIHRAFVLLFVAILIDATDGTLARAVKVKEVLPGFDGRRLDDIIDFLTYAALPLLLIWRAQILPTGLEAVLLVPLLASAYGFCQTEIKTVDGYFLGFPSYWNLIAFYMYTIHVYVAPLVSWLSIGLLLGFSLLTFVPTRYLYPSQRGRLNRITNMLGALWGILIILLLATIPTSDLTRQSSASILAPSSLGASWLPGLILVSLFFPIHYLVVSWIVSWQLRQRTRTAVLSPSCPLCPSPPQRGELPHAMRQPDEEPQP